MNAPPPGPRPPRPAEVLLRTILPDDFRRESILRDLRTEYRDVAERRGGSAPLWYWRQALSLAVHYTLARVRPDPGSAGAPSTDWMPMDSLARNLRFSFRRMRREPSFSLVAVLTIALGLGSTVAIYSVVDAVLLEPLPYGEPDELVAVWEWNVPRDVRTNVANPGNFRAWRERSETFDDMAAVALGRPIVLQAPGEPEEVTASFTSGNFFDVLGVEAHLGRVPAVTPDGLADPEIVLTHRFWQRKFGGDPDVVGRNITLDGTVGTVVGVLKPDYLVFAEHADLLAAIPIRGDQTSTGRYLNVVGRLAEGATLRQARDEMEAVAAGLEEEYPDFNAGWSVNLVPLQEEVVGDVRANLWLLLGAVGLLLLIACANVANLFLARATERRREMAVRTSLGAGGGRLAAQLLVESLSLAAVGAALGVAVAHLGTTVVARTLPDAFALPRVEAAGIDVGVLVFAGALTVCTGLLFGLVPALQAARTTPAAALASEGRGSGRGTARLRSGLVVAEVALSLTLLVAAGLLGRSFASLVSVDSGVDARGVVTGRVTVFGPEYEGSEPDQRFFTELARRVSAVPGVDAAGGVTFLPLQGRAAATIYYPADRPAPEPQDRPVAEVRNVVGDYFGAVGIGLLRGRTFDGRDRADAPDVVVINRALADREWPGEDPLGEHLRLQWSELEDLEVVGVVENVRQGLDSEAVPTVYLPYAQKAYFPSVTLTVRSTSLGPGAVARAVEGEIDALDPDLALSNVAPLEAVIARSVARPRMTAMLTGLFALVAAVLAAVGLYGVLAYTVSRRTREIGVRMAVGAAGGDMVRLVMVRGLGLTGVGILLGLGAALASGRLLESLLFQVQAADAVSLAGAALLLFVVAAVACFVPAWRATRVAPVEALRVD